MRRAQGKGAGVGWGGVNFKKVSTISEETWDGQAAEEAQLQSAAEITVVSARLRCKKSNAFTHKLVVFALPARLWPS